MHFGLLLEVFLVWGFCQSSLAIFFSSLFNSTQAATIVGYGCTIWSVIFGCCINMVVFQYPTKPPAIWNIYPFMPFVRNIYVIYNQCLWQTCFGNIQMAPAELHENFLLLVCLAVMYLLVGLYLH